MTQKHIWLAVFQATVPAAFPTKTIKYAKYRITMFSISCHIRPLTHALLNTVVDQNGSILMYFDKPEKIKDLTESKHFLRQITPQNKRYYFWEKKNFGVRCTLIATR